MSLSPYLAFAGNCAEAIAFYQQTLGAELMFKMTFGEMPPAAQEASDGCPSGQKMADDAIAHASLRINNGELMLSDSAFGPDIALRRLHLVLDPSDVAEGQRWFDALAVGGRIEMARQETFWGPRLRQSRRPLWRPPDDQRGQTRLTPCGGRPPCHPPGINSSSFSHRHLTEMQHKPVRIGPQREEAPRLCCVRLDDYAPVQTSDQLPHALSGKSPPDLSRSCAITIAAATICPPSSSWRRASTLTATPCAGLSTSWLSAAGFSAVRAWVCWC